MSEYVKINGVRVNIVKYERRLRWLERLEGKRVRVTTRGPGRAVHWATIKLVPPSGRRVYPAVSRITDCGAELISERETGRAITCQRCLKSTNKRRDL